MKLKLVDAQTEEKVSKKQSLIRTLMFFFIPINLLTVLLNSEGNTLSDILSKSKVVLTDFNNENLHDVEMNNDNNLSIKD